MPKKTTNASKAQIETKPEIQEVQEETAKEPEITPENPTAPQFTQEMISAMMQTPEAQAMMQAMVAEMLAKQPPVIVSAAKEETVTLLYMGNVAEGSIVELWQGFEIQGRGGTRDVPKKEFLQKLNHRILNRIKDRRLVIIDGFTDDERERYGVNYADGELCSSDVYYKLLGYPEAKIIDIFKKACFRHKQIIASMFATAYNSHDNRVAQTLVEKLNEISKETEPKGMFSPILKDMARALSGSDEPEEEM